MVEIKKLKIDLRIFSKKFIKPKSLNNHKNLFLKLIDELFAVEKSKINNKELINVLLNDESFHINFMILSFYIHINLLLVEKTFLLDEVIFLFVDNIKFVRCLSSPYVHFLPRKI